jgi:hypothetical protein
MLSVIPQVQGPSDSATSKGVSRTTFAVFMQPNIKEKLSLPSHPRFAAAIVLNALIRFSVSSIDAQRAVASNDFVPPLNERWQPGQDFIGFTSKTFAAYFKRDA